MKTFIDYSPNNAKKLLDLTEKELDYTEQNIYYYT